jgi:hypothetical protein
MFKFPAIILGGRFSPLPWQGRGLAYVVVRKSRSRGHVHTSAAGEFAALEVAASGRRAGHEAADALLTESTPLRSPPTAGEGAGRASEGQALPAGSARGQEGHRADGE